jgi:hypothetical protein
MKEAIAGANLVLNKSVFPLTPRFSAVQSNPQATKPFQRFSFAAIPTGREAVKTAGFPSLGGAPH